MAGGRRRGIEQKDAKVTHASPFDKLRATQGAVELLRSHDGAPYVALQAMKGRRDDQFLSGIPAGCEIVAISH